MSMKYRVQNGMKQSKRRAIAYNQAISSIHVMFSTLFPACFERLFFIRKSCHPFFPSNIKKRTFSLRRQFGDAPIYHVVTLHLHTKKQRIKDLYI